ncbi:helix-turn-helix domain-containing protein [Pelagibacterium halotolerans]|uniref:helix-turn-helix domain-containing protein n=1 Tax=Pelagibacterium halotolerans TaxID=531813 RepID=UPI00384D3D63
MTTEQTYIQTAQKPGKSGGSGAIPPERDRLVRRACREVGRHVAEAHGVTLAELLTPNRSRAKVAAARQVAMYLSHTLLSTTMTEVGRAFGRDRKTVSHACAAVEDMRDDKAVDEHLAALERVIEDALVAARMCPGKDREVRHARH